MIKKNRMEKKNSEYDVMDVKNVFIRIEKVTVLESI